MSSIEKKRCLAMRAMAKARQIAIGLRDLNRMEILLSSEKLDAKLNGLKKIPRHISAIENTAPIIIAWSTPRCLAENTIIKHQIKNHYNLHPLIMLLAHALL